MARYVIALLCALVVVSLPASAQFAPPPGPRVIRCTTACSGAALRVGDVLIIDKTAHTMRNSTTLRSADPDLHVTGLSLQGVYEVRLWFRFIGGPGGGVSWSLNSPAEALGVHQCQNATSAIYSVAGQAITCANALTLPQNYIVQAVAIMQSDPEIVVEWAQATSDPDDTILVGGSHLIVTRLR